MNRILFFVLYFVCAHLVFALDSNSSDSAEEVFEFVNKARERLILTTNPNIILVTGITGGGKSTLTHYVTGNYSKMIAIEPDGNKSENTIHDGLEDLDNLESSTVSRTFIPEMNVDEEQNMWYDCPGFADTRNETVEIATTFLIKSVIGNAKSIKVVLVVNYESVTEGHDRQDFDRSLSRLTELLQNTTRFEDSVSIVITKTPSYYIRGKQVIEVSEDSVEKSTANFARDHRSVLQQKGLNEKKIQMIDALLKQSPNGDYTKISVFWRPMEAGPFDEIEKMVKGRQFIRDSILKHISYSNFDEDDFGFPLTAETKLEITNIAQHTIGEINVVLKSIDSQLLSIVQQKIETTEDFLSKLDLLHNSGSFNNNETTLQQWIDRLISLIHSFDITSIDLNELNRIDRHENNLEILRSIAGIEIVPPIRDLIPSTSTTNQYLCSERIWYSFVLQVFNFFSGYEVQKDVTAYKVANLKDWGKINQPQGLTIDENNFAEFAKRFPVSMVSDLPLTPSQLRELNEIVDIALRSPVQYECNGETMVMKGNFVRSADIQPSKCSQVVKRIDVYVRSTFYADEDLNLNGIEELKVYAPTWSVQRATTLNLDGLEGEHQSPSPKGTPGGPGNAGSNGGNFFGFANEVINGELLTVTLNGGTGGAGQDGSTNDDVTVFPELENFKGPGDIYYEIQDLMESGKYKNFEFERKSFGHQIRYHENCCGTTGKGGLGGLGGQPGSYRFIKIKEDSTPLPRNIMNVGSNGRSGQTPVPCTTRAIDIIVRYIFGGSRSFQYIHKHINDPRCSDKYVKSTEPASKPKSPTKMDVTSGLSGYKTNLNENIQTSAFKKIIQKMSKILNRVLEK